MGRPKGSKDRDLARHVRERFAVRFNVNLTHALEKSIVKLIETGQSQFIEKQSNRVSRHRILLGEQEIDVIYDKTRGRLVTALFPDEEERWDKAILS